MVHRVDVRRRAFEEGSHCGPVTAETELMQRGLAMHIGGIAQLLVLLADDDQHVAILIDRVAGWAPQMVQGNLDGIVKEMWR